MALTACLSFCDSATSDCRHAVASLLQGADITTVPPPPPANGYALIILGEVNGAALEHVHLISRSATVLAIAISAGRIEADKTWALMRAGAADVLLWREAPAEADQIVARLARWSAVQALIDSPRITDELVGHSASWRNLLRQIVEVAAFTQATALIMGDSGTGKELIARLIHDLDRRPGKQDLIVVDCTTITPELSGSEFFGHERGAFTGERNSARTTKLNE